MSEPDSISEAEGVSSSTLQTLEALAETLSPAQTLAAARWLLARFDAAALREERFEFGSLSPSTADPGLTVLYGSHSGHSAAIAKGLAAQARVRGWSVTLANMAEYSRGRLKHEKNLAIVVSTHGEGQPPEAIVPFFEFLQGPRAPKLDDCHFAVLGLGDRSYVQFCKTGADFDVRLAQLGAQRQLERVELDVDYQDGADAWVARVLEGFALRMVRDGKAVSSAPGVNASGSVAPTRKGRYDREHPWAAELLERSVLSGRGSTQHFVHLELSLEGSRLAYEPGDALGVRPENDPRLVARLLQALGSSADTAVQVSGESSTLLEALTRRFEIRQPTPSALRKYAAMGAAGLADIVANPDASRDYLKGRDWLDLFHEHPLELTAAEFVKLLPELASRSYSITSSQRVHPDEVHLLVSRVEYAVQGRVHQGVASSYLADRVQPGDKLAVWIESNPAFRLPKDPEIPIVLIGAGTGVAPYRAMLEQRGASGAKGKNWLIFGNRNFRSDFTYQTEWLAWRSQGLLTRIDVAFSRDTKHKAYVTDRVVEAGRELYAWLEQGAHVYLCGDRAKLSASLDDALVRVLVSHAGSSHEQALEYLARLQREGRYRKDVY